MTDLNRLKLFALEGGNSGCNFYRIRQPVYKIIQNELMLANSSSLCSQEDTETWLQKSDIIFTQLAKSKNLLDHIIMNKRGGVKQKVVIDYDDHLFAVSPYNPAYRFHGIEELDIETQDGSTYQIRDGDTEFYGGEFNIEENKKVLVNFGQVLKLADMVITPSPVLSGFFKRFNKNTRVVKNLLNLNVWKPIEMAKDFTVRIGYQGGWSHFIDWFECKEALEFVMNKYTHTELVIMGTSYPGTLKGLPQDRVRLEGFEPMDVYPWKFKTLNIDIGICPLSNDEFSNCKSEIKWEEYSSLKIPTVASQVAPYSLNINHGEDGFLAKDTKEWIEYLSLLIENAELRKKIGNQARQRIERDYDLDKGAGQYVELFESLYKKELVIV